MPCMFAANLGYAHTRLFVTCVAAVGAEFKVNTTSALLRFSPVLRRLSVHELQSLLLQITAAVVIGGHVDHTVLSEAMLYHVYKTAAAIAVDSKHPLSSSVRLDLCESLVEEFSADTALVRSLRRRILDATARAPGGHPGASFAEWQEVAHYLSKKRIGDDYALKTRLFESKSPIVFSDDAVETYGELYLEPEPLYFNDQDVRRGRCLVQLVERPQPPSEGGEVVPKARADVVADGINELVNGVLCMTRRDIKRRPSNLVTHSGLTRSAGDVDVARRYWSKLGGTERERLATLSPDDIDALIESAGMWLTFRGIIGQIRERIAEAASADSAAAIRLPRDLRQIDQDAAASSPHSQVGAALLFSDKGVVVEDARADVALDSILVSLSWVEEGTMFELECADVEDDCELSQVAAHCFERYVSREIAWRIIKAAQDGAASATADRAGADLLAELEAERRAQADADSKAKVKKKKKKREKRRKHADSVGKDGAGASQVISEETEGARTHEGSGVSPAAGDADSASDSDDDPLAALIRGYESVVNTTSEDTGWSTKKSKRDRAREREARQQEAALSVARLEEREAGHGFEAARDPEESRELAAHELGRVRDREVAREREVVRERELAREQEPAHEREVARERELTAERELAGERGRTHQRVTAHERQVLEQGLARSREQETAQERNLAHDFGHVRHGVVPANIATAGGARGGRAGAVDGTPKYASEHDLAREHDPVQDGMAQQRASPWQRGHGSAPGQELTGSALAHDTKFPAPTNAHYSAARTAAGGEGVVIDRIGNPQARLYPPDRAADHDDGYADLGVAQRVKRGKRGSKNNSLKNPKWKSAPCFYFRKGKCTKNAHECFYAHGKDDFRAAHQARAGEAVAGELWSLPEPALSAGSAPMARTEMDVAPTPVLDGAVQGQTTMLREQSELHPASAGGAGVLGAPVASASGSVAFLRGDHDILATVPTLPSERTPSSSIVDSSLPFSLGVDSDSLVSDHATSAATRGDSWATEGLSGALAGAQWSYEHSAAPSRASSGPARSWVTAPSAHSQVPRPGSLGAPLDFSARSPLLVGEVPAAVSSLSAAGSAVPALPSSHERSARPLPVGSGIGGVEGGAMVDLSFMDSVERPDADAPHQEPPVEGSIQEDFWLRRPLVPETGLPSPQQSLSGLHSRSAGTMSHVETGQAASSPLYASERSSGLIAPPGLDSTRGSRTVFDQVRWTSAATVPTPAVARAASAPVGVGQRTHDAWGLQARPAHAASSRADPVGSLAANELSTGDWVTPAAAISEDASSGAFGSSLFGLPPGFSPAAVPAAATPAPASSSSRIAAPPAATASRATTWG